MPRVNKSSLFFGSFLQMSAFRFLEFTKNLVNFELLSRICYYFMGIALYFYSELIYADSTPPPPISSPESKYYAPLISLAKSMVPVEKMIVGFAYVMGIGFFLKAMLALKQVGEAKTMMSSNTNIKEPLVYLLVGSMLVYFPTALQVMLSTTFGTSNILAYQNFSSTNNTINSLFGSYSESIEALVLIIQVIGFVAFVRGWVLIARSASQGQQPGGVGKGLVHIFGGILAINIVLTIQIVNNTLGYST